MDGFVFLHRKTIEWEWYDEPNTMRLFLHCLLKANHKANKWRGVEVNAGEFITSIGKLAEELKLSKQNIRTAIRNLQSTQEITHQSTHHYTLIKVVKWGKYQHQGETANTPSNRQPTHAQHTLNTRLTTNNKDNNENNDKKERKKNKEKTEHLLGYSSQFVETFVAFREMRKKMKSAMTDKAEEMILTKLKKLSPKEPIQIEILEQSIMNGWKSVFDLKGEFNGKNQGRTKREINTAPDDAF